MSLSVDYNFLHHSCFHYAGFDINAVPPVNTEGNVKDNSSSHESKVQSEAGQCSDNIDKNNSYAGMHNGAHCILGKSGDHERTGGALWDIFRREDSDKLQDYLRTHAREFRHVNCNPVKQVLFSLQLFPLFFQC